VLVLGFIIAALIVFLIFRDKLVLIYTVVVTFLLVRYCIPFIIAFFGGIFKWEVPAYMPFILEYDEWVGTVFMWEIPDIWYLKLFAPIVLVLIATGISVLFKKYIIESENNDRNVGRLLITIQAVFVLGFLVLIGFVIYAIISSLIR